MKTNNMRVSNEWARRPNDQRFTTMADLYARVASRRSASRVADVALDTMQLQLAGDDADSSIMLTDRTGSVQAELNNWTFGQLCSRAKAPAAYLRTLPAALAMIPLQYSLEAHEMAEDESNDAKLLVQADGNGDIVSAITSPTYGRIWDADVVQSLMANVDLDAWKVPAASYADRDPKRATTLYASDRDVFVFLVNESTVDAAGEVLRRGFYVSNSEVGSASLEIACFTYDYVCDNRIIWGQSNFKSLNIRHTSGGPHRFVQKAVPQLAAYVQSSAASMAEAVRTAKAREVGKDRKSVVEWMRARGFTASVGGKAYDAAEKDPRGYNPRTVWGLVQGVTDVAHDVTHTDARVDLETRAGGLLETL